MRASIANSRAESLFAFCATFRSIGSNGGGATEGDLIKEKIEKAFGPADMGVFGSVELNVTVASNTNSGSLLIAARVVPGALVPLGAPGRFNPHHSHHSRHSQFPEHSLYHPDQAYEVHFGCADW